MLTFQNVVKLIRVRTYWALYGYRKSKADHLRALSSEPTPAALLLMTRDDFLALQTRRLAFERLADNKRFQSAVREKGEAEFAAVCPCCGYLTQTQRRSDTFCCICHWQDCGGDDHPGTDYGADSIDGANGCTLTQARANFIAEGHRYSSSDTDGVERMALDAEPRARMVALFQSILPAPTLERYLAIRPQLEDALKRADAVLDEYDD